MPHEHAPEITYRVSPPVSNDELNAVFATAWPNHTPTDFSPVLSRSLAYVCAYVDGELAGFVNLAWDGHLHAFLLDTTVRADLQRRGIGRGLVIAALEAARGRGITWVHVDFEPHLRAFYAACGFRPTEAGLVKVDG